ncbi:BRD4-interacting chromatin-remodeling complex-associated protein isoform X2 [Denticeps clupeoides]|uniref:BRD4-interacting chromatin-remodeling complex-associated protein isoform X2 n=1 Tax=Denticeps clupeoides TaxID=299321 RepID=UPI0010A3B17F|nr:BRD4-interacting chromatin-remodeling complex-associated protein isoform X2 [Denticeps clupeoides]
MDDEDGRCLLDVICDPEALNDFLHGSETQLDTDDLLDGSSDPSSSFFSSTGGHVPEVQPVGQLVPNESSGLPRVSVDLDFLEDDDILGGSPGGTTGGDGGSNGVGSSHEPCDILQQSLAEANITEQSLQEAELDLSSFGLSGLTQVVQPLPDPSLSGAGGAAVGVGIGVGGAQIFTPPSGSSAGPASGTPDMLGSVLAHPGIQLQSQVMNKAISVQPFMQSVGLGNVTLQPISSIQAIQNGSQSGHLGIGQIQVVGQPTVMTINQPGQQILAKTIGSYQLHQPGQEATAAGTQAGLGGSVLSSSGQLLIQGPKTAIGSPALNGPAVCVSSTNTNNSGNVMTAPGGLVGFSSAGIGTQAQAQAQGQIMQNVIIQRTPTPIQPKPPQGTIQPKLFKQPQQQLPVPHTLQNDASKALGVPVSTAQNVTFLTGKPGSNMVLSTQATSQGAQFPQALFKQQAPPTSGKPLSVHLLNQSGSIVIPSQTVIQGQNQQFLVPQLPTGSQILTQHPGGQIIANQILTNQNINLGQVLASQGHSGAAHILSGPIQLQPGQIGHPTLFQMPVSLAQTQPVTGHAQTVIQGMPIQNSLTMLSQVEGVSPAVSLQPTLQQQQAGGVPSNTTGGAAAMAQSQPGESVTVLGTATDQATLPTQPQAQTQPSILSVQTAPQPTVPTSVTASSSPSSTVATSASMATVGLVAPQAQHSPGKVLFTTQGPSMILSQESLQMFLQQDPQHQASKDPPPPSVGVPASVTVSGGISGPVPSAHDSLLTEARPSQSPSPTLGPAHMTPVVNKVPSAGTQQPLKIQSASPSQALATHTVPPTLSDSPQASQPSPLTLGQHIQSPLPHQQPQPPSQTQTQTPSRSGTPSSLPPLFIIHNPIASSPLPPQPAPQPQPLQPQIQVQIQPQTTPSQPAPLQQDVPPASSSPKPAHALPAQPSHFVQAAAAAGPNTTVVKQQAQLPGLTAEQQHHLQLVSSQLQVLSAVAQPTAQQKQLLEKLQQVQQNIILQAKQQTQTSQPPVTGQFSKSQELAPSQVVTSSAGACTSVPVPSLLPPKTVLVQGPGDMQVFSAAPVPAVATVNQGIAQQNLTQSGQSKPGVISSVPGLAIGKGLQIQVLNPGLNQMPAPQPPVPVQPQISSMKRSFIMEPSKEARMLEQIRKQQGSVLHPDYSSPFRSFEDSLHRLLPYHLYQGTASSPQDYQRVDDEFESVSSQLLRRTQAMLDKYRHLLFEESRRLGPSAEMVMIDRMFIQEEKIALSQDRVMAKERPEEFVASSCLIDKGAQRHMASEASLARPAPLAVGAPPVPPVQAPPTPAPAPAAPPAPAPLPAPVAAPAPVPVPAPVPAPVTAAVSYPPTKLVIKQGGGGASVSWSTSCTPAPSTGSRPPKDASAQSSSFTRTPSASTRPARNDDDDDALPQRTSKPPIKTYEARQRIGLKLKIKQEAGLSKVVHNTALDPVHSQPQTPTPEVPQPKIRSAPPAAASVIRTPPLPPAACHTATASSVSTVTTQASSNPRTAAPSSSTPSPFRSSHTWSSSTSSASAAASSTSQMNGTLEHHDSGGVKHNPASTPAPPLTTCRLPLRKTYRENVSPRIRPGVPGGGGEIIPNLTSTSSSSPRRSSPKPEQTVIASVKLERQGGHLERGPRDGRVGQGLSPTGLAEVEDVLYHGIKNAYHHHRLSDKEEEEGEPRSRDRDDRAGRSKFLGVKNRDRPDRTFRMDQHAPGPPSPEGSSFSRDSSLPAKRCKSDSPDVDNASFSSGSPPPDDSLNEHLQCAIDSILNLQQGPPGRSSGKVGTGRTQGPLLSQQHQTQCPGTSSSYRPSVASSSSSSTSSSSMTQRPQVGGRGQNGSLVSQTHSR